MMLLDSLSNVCHLSASLNGQLFTSKRRRLNSLFVWSKSNTLRPLRQPAPADESPSMNASFEPSGENVGTIIAVLPKPQTPGVAAVTSSGAPPTACGVCQ